MRTQPALRRSGRRRATAGPSRPSRCHLPCGNPPRQADPDFLRHPRWPRRATHARGPGQAGEDGSVTPGTADRRPPTSRSSWLSRPARNTRREEHDDPAGW